MKYLLTLVIVFNLQAYEGIRDFFDTNPVAKMFRTTGSPEEFRDNYLRRRHGGGSYIWADPRRGAEEESQSDVCPGEEGESKPLDVDAFTPHFVSPDQSDQTNIEVDEDSPFVNYLRSAPPVHFLKRCARWVKRKWDAF